MPGVFIVLVVTGKKAAANLSQPARRVFPRVIIELSLTHHVAGDHHVVHVDASIRQSRTGRGGHGAPAPAVVFEHSDKDGDDRVGVAIEQDGALQGGRQQGRPLALDAAL